MSDPAQALPGALSHQVAERVAVQSITDTFRLLGVDISAMEDLNDLRDDFRFIRRMRQSDEFRRTEFTKSAIAALVGGLIGMIVMRGRMDGCGRAAHTMSPALMSHFTRRWRPTHKVLAAMLGLVIGNVIGRLLLIWLAVTLHGG